MKIYQSFSSAKTKKIGELLAKKIAKSKLMKKAVILALSGDLGSGKTTFVQGFFRGLKIKKRATSPTFVVMRKFGVKNFRFKNVYHMDCYRLRKPDELSALGFREIADNPKNIVLIEWPERVKGIFPKRPVNIGFRHGRRINERIIKISQI